LSFLLVGLAVLRGKLLFVATTQLAFCWSGFICADDTFGNVVEHATGQLRKQDNRESP
jgi:hypothetical protein